MGKRGGKKKGPEHTSGQHIQMSFKEEVNGKKQTNSLQSIMKLQHLQNLAVWAAGEASIPSLGALFGRQFAATGEALGLPPDPSLVPCQRCETILQPGFNCTIRVVKNRAKTHGQTKKPISAQQNNVVYKCHFCAYENLKRGTPKGHMKDICPPKPKQPSKPKPTHKKQATPSKQNTTNRLEAEKTGETASPSPSTAKESTSSVAENPPTTPAALKGLTLLDSKKRKRNKAKPMKPDESEAKSAMMDAKKAEIASSKRRRKGWTTLKEIAESNERERTKTFTNLSIPFTL